MSWLTLDQHPNGFLVDIQLTSRSTLHQLLGIIGWVSTDCWPRCWSSQCLSSFNGLLIEYRLSVGWDWGSIKGISLHYFKETVFAREQPEKLWEFFWNEYLILYQSVLPKLIKSFWFVLIIHHLLEYVILISNTMVYHYKKDWSGKIHSESFKYALWCEKITWLCKLHKYYKRRVDQNFWRFEQMVISENQTLI